MSKITRLRFRLKKWLNFQANSNQFNENREPTIIKKIRIAIGVEIENLMIGRIPKIEQ